MVRVSNIVLGFLNGIILIIGIAAICTSVYIMFGSNSRCERGIENELMIIGSALFVVALLGLIGSCYRLNFFLILYLIVMFVLIVGLICFTFFTVFVTNEAAGEVASRSKIMNFKSWIRYHFVNDKNWNRIRECLIDAKICQSLGVDVDPIVSDFYKKNLSPIQSGCCKPPTECGFKHQNATFWVETKTGPAVANSDCSTWSNEQKKLCYNCESCKDGIVGNIRHQWKALAIANVCVTVVLVILYSVGCCARKNNSKKSYGKFRGYRPYP